jgi:predicted HicB family RNase H-like nuclease
MQEARLKAAELGISLHQFVSEAMEEKLATQLEQTDQEDRL